MNQADNQTDSNKISTTKHQQQMDGTEHDTDLQTKYYNLIGIVGCIGGFMIELVLGSLYQWGIISIYVTSYFHIFDSTVNLQSNAIAFPLMMFCMGLTIALGVILSEKINPIIILTVNSILAALQVFASSYVTNIWSFIALYGIAFGLTAGMNLMVPIVVCNKYFPGKKMYVNGFVLVGIGMGSLVFGFFSYNFLNPDRLAPIDGLYQGSPQLLSIANQVPVLLRWLSLIYLAIGVVGCILIAPLCFINTRKQNKLKKKQSTDEYLPLIGQVNEVNLEQDTRQAKSLKQALNSKVFWLQVIILILGATGVFMLNGNYKTYVNKNINDDQFLTTVGAIGSLGNGCSRFFWNILFSKTGYKTVILIIVAIQIIVFATIQFSINSRPAFFIQIFLANCCIGGYMVTAPTFSQAVFGPIIGSKIYSFYWLSIATANFIGFGLVQAFAVSIGFKVIIYICLALSIVAIPFIILSKFEGPWKNNTLQLQYYKPYEIEKLKFDQLKNESNL